MRNRRIGLLAAIIAVLLLALVGSNTGFADTASGTPDVGAYDSNYVYQQIVDHKLPIAPDGKPTSFSWGRYYTGANGLEFRLNNDATWFVIYKTFKADIVLDVTLATGKPGTMGDVALESVPSLGLTTAMKLAGVYVSDKITATTEATIRSLLFQKNLCLGMTIPPKAVPTALDRAAALARGQTILATQGPYYNDTKIWFETCTPGYESKDVTAPQAPPVGDIQPAVKAIPIPVPAQPAQPVAPVTAPASSPAPITHAAPPPPPPTPPEACWLAGPDYRTYVRTSNQNDVLFYEREREPDAIIQLQVPNPKWMTWTQFSGGVWRLEGAYKDPEGQDMWTEGEFWSAPFWTDGKTQEEIDTQLQAYHQLQSNWGHDMNLVATATQC